MWWRLVIHHNRWPCCRRCDGGGRYLLLLLLLLWGVRGANTACRAAGSKVRMLATILWALGLLLLKGDRGRRGPRGAAGLVSASSSTIASTAVAIIAAAGDGGTCAPGHEAPDPRELAASRGRLWWHVHTLLRRALAPRLESV
jgi:hypothetical protein